MLEVSAGESVNHGLRWLCLSCYENNVNANLTMMFYYLDLAKSCLHFVTVFFHLRL